MQEKASAALTMTEVAAASLIGVVMVAVLRSIGPAPAPPPPPAQATTDSAERSAAAALTAVERDLAHIVTGRTGPPLTVAAGGAELAFRTRAEAVRFRLAPSPTAGVHRLERTTSADGMDATTRPVDGAWVRSVRWRLLIPRPEHGLAWQARSPDASTYLETHLEATDPAGARSVRRVQVSPLRPVDSKVRETTKGE